MASPTATTTSRMALRVSTDPEGPPVPIRFFLSLRRRSLPGLVRPFPRLARERPRRSVLLRGPLPPTP